MPSETPIDATLRTARDLCLGVGAFFVTSAGAVFSDSSDVLPIEGAGSRIAALARSCLSHPAAHGTDLFWTAEPDDESETPHPDSSLACVVAPVWSEQWLGLLGVIDLWLPELDEEQRDGLLALAASLAGTGAGEQWGTPPGDVEPGAHVPGETRGETPGEVVASTAVPSARAAVEPGGPAPDTEPGPGPVRLDQRAEPFLGEVLDNLPEGLLVTRADGTVVLVNRTFSAMTGLEIDAILGEDVVAILEPGVARGDRGHDEEGPRTPGGVREVAQLLGGAARHATVSVIGAEGGEILRADGRRIESRFAGDCFITLLRKSDRAVETPEDAVQQSLDHIEDGIVCADARGSVVFANRAACVLQGLGPDELAVGTQYPASTALRTGDGDPVSAEQHPLQRALREGAPVNEDLVLGEGGHVVHVAVSARPLRIDGEDCAIAVLRDVTAERERQEHLTHYALHDPLTGVANRYLLDDTLGRMLEALTRRTSAVSLVYLDLDDFKAINDHHGHEIGDQVLRAVARRLERAVRGEDIVARVGGDEFVVAHVSEERVSDGDTVVARIRKVLSAPYRVGGLVLDVRASVGSVTTSSSAETPESLISRADRAMYERKTARHGPGGGVVA